MNLFFELQMNLSWDEGMTQLALRFLINLIMIMILVRFVYYGYKKDNEFAFTFILFNITIFFICFLMLTINISLGVAFGLFAIFGILRYRTDTIPIKDMTYLFTAIALAMINAIGPFELMTITINVVLVFVVFLMEKMWYSSKEQYKNIQYERIDLLQSNQEEAIKDIAKRTGLEVTRIEIKSYNFLNDSAALKVYYKLY